MGKRWAHEGHECTQKSHARQQVSGRHLSSSERSQRLWAARGTYASRQKKTGMDLYPSRSTQIAALLSWTDCQKGRSRLDSTSAAH